MKWVVGCLAGTVVTVGAAAATVDVSQRTIDRHVDPLDFGQSFTAGRDAGLSAVRMSMAARFGGSNITVRVHEYDPVTETLSAAVLGSGRLLEPQLTAEPAWREVALATPVPLSAGRTYAFTVEADDPGGTSTGWNTYGVTFSDTYSGGETFYGLSGRVGTGSNLEDLAFETVVVPEPAGAAAAAAAVGQLARRRRRT